MIKKDGETAFSLEGSKKNLANIIPQLKALGRQVPFTNERYLFVFKNIKREDVENLLWGHKLPFYDASHILTFKNYENYVIVRGVYKDANEWELIHKYHPRFIPQPEDEASAGNLISYHNALKLMEELLSKRIPFDDQVKKGNFPSTPPRVPTRVREEKVPPKIIKAPSLTKEVIPPTKIVKVPFPVREVVPSTPLRTVKRIVGPSMEEKKVTIPLDEYNKIIKTISDAANNLEPIIEELDERQMSGIATDIETSMSSLDAVVISLRKYTAK